MRCAVATVTMMTAIRHPHRTGDGDRVVQVDRPEPGDTERPAELLHGVR
jgi:hypothetical protein